MPSKKAFTLIEIVIVVVIIGILMLIGMGLNRSQLKSLKASTAVEALESRFDTFLLQNMNSNYHQGHLYQKAEIELKIASNTDETSTMQYRFSSSDQEDVSNQSQTERKRWEFLPLFSHSRIQLISLSALQKNTQENLKWSRLQIYYTPFQIGCKLLLETQESSEVLLQMQPHGGNPVCFQLKESYCRLQKISCPEV